MRRQELLLHGGDSTASPWTLTPFPALASEVAVAVTSSPAVEASAEVEVCRRNLMPSPALASQVAVAPAALQAKLPQE